ncbi:PepSY-associated TM helix domain-containing protein [Sulfurospirillum halorespirans]|uniref:PiuB-like domain-containing protein n=1 Tax=Sulfurospirillum halorespirans DSM 13726 TaxID=1193502 RepID=A0A1D7TKW8_9BACT|nr:PepSY-associated TM helix domain-containing protein [Sulfurospirillum halorespirans]AOO65637.1 hypothetical protein SHALO_1866 [Sulfurospirillum halorespirans DSM 13726]
MNEINASKLWKQRLLRLHAALGMVVSLVMYISVFFGIFAIFLPYLQVWEKPSRHIERTDVTQIEYKTMLNQVLEDPNFPKNNLLITLPGTKGETALSISHRFSAPLFFNPFSGEKIQDEGAQSHLAGFLNKLHYGKVLDFDKELFGVAFSFLGRLLFGFMAVGVMSIVISGVILIIIFSYKNKPKTPQALFSRLHVKIFTWVFPIFLLITLSGAFMNLSLLSSIPMAKLASGGKESRIDAIIGPVLFPKEEARIASGETAPMLPIKTLITKAQTLNPQINFQQLKLVNWNATNAQIELKGYDITKPFLNGGAFNKPSLTLSAVDGSLISEQKALDRSWSVFFAEATFFLHFLAGVDIISRTLVALVMVASALAIGFGVMLWLEKQAKKFDERIPFYHWMAKFSLSIMVGVIPATGVLFVLQWLLPFDLSDRLLWQKGLFYNAWLATLFWAFYRFNTYQAAKEFLALGGVLFIGSVLLHWFMLGFFPFSPILGVDIWLLLLGCALLWSARKLPCQPEAIQSFWIKKEERA